MFRTVPLSILRSFSLYTQQWYMPCSFADSKLSANLKPATRILLEPNHTESPTHRTKKKTTDVVIQQNSRKLLMMDILMSETCWAHKKWNKIASDIKLVLYSSTMEYTSLELGLVTRIQPLHWKRFLVLCNIRTVASGLNAWKRKRKEFTVNYWETRNKYNRYCCA